MDAQAMKNVQCHSSPNGSLQHAFSTNLSSLWTLGLIVDAASSYQTRPLREISSPPLRMLEVRNSINMLTTMFSGCHRKLKITPSIIFPSYQLFQCLAGCGHVKEPSKSFFFSSVSMISRISACILVSSSCPWWFQCVGEKTTRPTHDFLPRTLQQNIKIYQNIYHSSILPALQGHPAKNVWGDPFLLGWCSSIFMGLC